MQRYSDFCMPQYVISKKGTVLVKKVLTIGGALQDIFIDFKEGSIPQIHLKEANQSFIALEEGKKIAIEDIHTFVGGGAANTAVSFSKLGFDTEAFFKIGNDAPGNFILDHMRQQNVNVDNIIKTNKKQTGISFIIPCASGDKSALVYRGANLTLSKKELPFDRIDACDILYITSLSFNLAKLLPPIVKYARKKGKYVAINPGSNQVAHGAADLMRALPYVDILILNSYESNLLMESIIKKELIDKKRIPILGLKNKKHVPQLLQSATSWSKSCFGLESYFKHILSIGPKVVVVTNGAEGVYAASKKIIYFYPSPKKKVVSTVGAGDSFGSAFVGSLLQGKSIEDALISGTANSSSVISHIGTQTGLLDKKALARKIKKARKNLLQKFLF